MWASVLKLGIPPIHGNSTRENMGHTAAYSICKTHPCDPTNASKLLQLQLLVNDQGRSAGNKNRTGILIGKKQYV